jgi:hypothetical protein
MRHALLVVVTLAVISSLSQQATHAQSGVQPSQTQGQPVQAQTPVQTPAQPTQTPPKGCLAVKPMGSHSFRNIMLFGVAGALISKQQYEIIDAINYPARVGQKFHGNDLQTISSGGIKVVILDKRYTTEDLHKACQ